MGSDENFCTLQVSLKLLTLQVPLELLKGTRSEEAGWPGNVVGRFYTALFSTLEQTHCECANVTIGRLYSVVLSVNGR